MTGRHSPRSSCLMFCILVDVCPAPAWIAYIGSYVFVCFWGSGSPCSAVLSFLCFRLLNASGAFRSQKIYLEGDKGTLERSPSFQIPTTIIGYSSCSSFRSHGPLGETSTSGTIPALLVQSGRDDPFSARYMDRWISETSTPLPDRQQKSAVAEKIDSFTSGSPTAQLLPTAPWWRRRSWLVVS